MFDFFQVVPPDGGWGWVVVVASFVCNVLVDGIVYSCGLLLPSISKEFNVIIIILIIFLIKCSN